MLTDGPEAGTELPAREGWIEDTDLDAILVYNLAHTLNYLEPHIDNGLRQSRLTGAQLNTLLVLRTAGEGGLPMSEIGRRLVVTKANVTGLVDRLERQGLVWRDTHEDRRVTVVRLTAAAEALLTEVIPAHRRLLSELTDGLSTDEKAQLVRLLTKLRRALRERLRGDASGEGTGAGQGAR